MTSDAARAACAALALALAPAPAAAERIECPPRVAYAFAFEDPRLPAGGEGGWRATLHRGGGERTAGLPKLSVRGGELRCEYELPNGAFALAKRPLPEGAACRVGQDDAFSIPHFLCE